jgi:hypothetical protein
VQDQELRRPKAYDGGILDTEIMCPPLRIVEKDKLQHLRALEEHRLAGDVAKARAEFVAEQAEKIAKKTNKPIDVARAIVARQCDGVLLPDVVLPFDSAELDNSTVADVLADPERFEADLKERTGRGPQAIKRTLKEAEGQRNERRRAEERNRQLAERTDPRPQISVPPSDSPWLPVMQAIENVLIDAREPEPPIRDLDDDVVQKKLRRVPNMHAFAHANDGAR